MRGGWIRCAHPAGSVAGFAVQRVALSNPGGASHPLSQCNMQKKSLNFRSGSSSECGGERGIRTPDTLPYTHFPGVLLQPLGHLTTFTSLTALGQRGATIGSRLKTVKHYFFLLIYSLKLCTNRFATLQNRRFIRLSLPKSSALRGPGQR